jgi:hypothetical protein
MTLTDPLIATLALPVAVTVALAVALRLLGGVGIGARLASFGVPAAVVVSVAVLPGLAPTPPVTVLEKLVWLAAIGGLLGVLIEMVTSMRLITGIVAFVSPLLAVAWVYGIDLTGGSGEFPYRAVEVAVVAGLLNARLHQISRVEVSAPITTAVIAAGLAAVALVTGPAYASAVGLPLAAAGIGWLVCNWPTRRLPWGAPGEVGAGGAVMALAAVLAYAAAIPVFLVLLVLMVLAIEPLARRFVAANALTKSDAVRPIAFAAIVALPAVLAVVLALYAPALVPRLYVP